MAAASVTLTKITVEASGRVLVRFGKDVREYASLAAMKASVRAALDRNDLIDLALALLLTRQPNLGNPSALEGHALTVDLTLANWGTLS